MSLSNFNNPNVDTVYTNIMYTNTIDSVDFNGDLNIGLVKPGSVGAVRLASAGTDLYLKGELYIPGSTGGSYNVIAPASPTDNNGIKITGSNIGCEYADLTHNGILSTGTQSIGGTKTFSNARVSGELRSNNIREYTTDNGISFKSNTDFGNHDMYNCNCGYQNNIAIGPSAGQQIFSNPDTNANVFLGTEVGRYINGGVSNFGACDYAIGGINQGSHNIAIGTVALYNTNGNHNICLGLQSGRLVYDGENNICFGQYSGYNMVANDSNCICIGANQKGFTGQSNYMAIGNDDTSKCFINGINGVTTVDVAIPVLIDGNGQLGTMSSLRDLKENIIDLDEEENKQIIESLIPHKFNFKGNNVSHYGLIVDEVKCNELLAYDKNNKPYTVRYDQLNILLLKEIQRLNKLVDKLNNI